jgi:radical SAM superfamily enzyme with C-terminal helix-hairpin-helix motif
MNANKAFKRQRATNEVGVIYFDRQVISFYLACYLNQKVVASLVDQIVRNHDSRSLFTLRDICKRKKNRNYISLLIESHRVRSIYPNEDPLRFPILPKGKIEIT